MKKALHNSSPTISVIIPSYKTAGMIAVCLESVFAQTYSDFEAIVINDGSPDTAELEKVLEPYIERIVYIKQENKRAAGARNTGIRQARGEFIAFLDSDDSWMPEHLSSQMQMFADDPTLDLVYSNSLLLGDPTRECQFMERCPSHGEATFDALIEERCQIPISTVVVRKSGLQTAGLFDESLQRCDDYDMWVRTAFHGAKIGYSRKVQAKMYAGRPGSLGASRFKMAEGYWIILEKLDKTLPLSNVQRKLVRERAAEIRALTNYENAKSELSDRHFDNAIRLLAEANRHMRSNKLTVALLGLKIAPSVTRRCWSFWGAYTVRRRSASGQTFTSG